jgi:hypothetical protein
MFAFMRFVETYGRDTHTTDDHIIRRLHFASSITKATNMHLEYAILIALSLQLWLHESASIFSCTYIAYLFFF